MASRVTLVALPDPATLVMLPPRLMLAPLLVVIVALATFKLLRSTAETLDPVVKSNVLALEF